MSRRNWLVLASILWLRFLTDRLLANWQGFSQERVNVSRRGHFDGILAVCMSQPNLHIPLALLEIGAGDGDPE
jgi:hypothetical protein